MVSMLQRIMRKFFGRQFYKMECCKNFKYDYEKFFCNSLNAGHGKKQQLANILLKLHQLEKGMSFTESARTFGEQKAIDLINTIRQYLKNYEKNEVIVLGINVLSEYLSHPNSTKNAEVRLAISTFIFEHKDDVGTFKAGIKKVSEPLAFDEILLKDFFFSRSSVREFSDKPITDEEIINVMNFASCTPTACNRQTARVHVYRERQLMNKLIENQLGNQNWCDNATAIFVITSDVSYFNATYEHLQAWVDGGLYAMNFDWGLHLYHIASCFKMYVRTPEIDREFHEVSGIPEDEVPIVLILAGHYKDNFIMSPRSVRFPVKYGFNLFLH